MKKLFLKLSVFILKLILSLRYRVKVRGLEKLTSDNLKKSGGILFLPNHPAALVDPLIVSLAVFNKFPIRPLIIEYMYFLPFIYPLMKRLKALPVPNFEASNNSLKRKRHERVINEVIKGLKTGENFLLYPAGRLKHTNIEKIGGASATSRIIKETPESNIVLVRIKGLWGSSFSRALTGEVPPIFPTLKKGFKVLLKNLIFFTPRRRVEVEFEPAPKDFPYHASRLGLNRWLEKWYNKPDGLTEQSGKLLGDSLRLVSYSFWKEEIPEVFQEEKRREEAIKFEDIDQIVQDKVLEKLQELTELDIAKILPKASLASDLGMDSLDISELATFIQDSFDTNTIPITELTTVERVMGIAAGKIKLREEEEEKEIELKKWQYNGPKFRARIAEGETLPEVFLNICEKMGSAPAIADSRSGILTYSRLKMGAILLADYIRTLPGKYVGILLPASVGAFLTVFACHLAGKVPLMINWTIGPSHLEAVRDLTGVESVLTSWAFLDRLDTVDLNGLDDKLIMLETVKREFSVFAKIRAFFRSMLPAKRIMKIFEIDRLSKKDEEVLLFTSGTESMPKGVPLSFENILSNQRAGLATIPLYSDDVLLAFLPPFHSFGFCITGLMGILAGVRTAFFPNPTDGKGLARAFKNWQATITCGAPTFIKSMLKAADEKQLKTMRYCITGAESTPPELLDLLRRFSKVRTHLEGYGITECAPIISTHIPGKTRAGVGRPLPGIELIIVHPETHKPLERGAEGLILARGPNIFSGYLNPGLESPFLNIGGKKWYNTGDIGYFDEHGNLTISGRKKRFIKIGAEMVSLPAIENALLRIAPKMGWPLKEESPSLGIIAREAPGEKPTIALITTFDLDIDLLNRTIRKCGFSNLIRITDVIKMEEIPIMGTGKINYRFLEEKFFDEMQDNSEAA